MTVPTPFDPVLCVVNFNHQRGPEVEHWFGIDPSDPTVENEWSLLPFLALSDGSHAATEDFSYFTLVRRQDEQAPSTSVFGISCTRQLDASTLINRPPDVTRSTVQKAVVVITDAPQTFSAVREKLSVVARAWFTQRDFTDTSILRDFRESLVKGYGDNQTDHGPEGFLGLSLREIIRTYKWQTLVLLKCLLLQPKMLFFGQQCERVCLLQFSLITLIPELMRNLNDCADPQMDSYAKNLVKPTTLKTSERASLLSYMGLPLQIFGKGSFFGPYTPLQQLDLLMDQDTKSYVVGSTNSLLLQSKDKYADVLVNLDDNTVSIFSPSLKSALALSTADKRWIDFVTQAVNDTWDEAHPSRPKDMGFTGSDEMIRMQFEEYLLSLVSCVRYHEYMLTKPTVSQIRAGEVESDPSSEYNDEFISQWQRTENYSLLKRTTDSHLFDVVEAKHPCAGGLTVEDVQRRVAQQVQDLHLDERWRDSKEVLGKHLAEGQKRVSGALNNLLVDIDTRRKAQQQRRAEGQLRATPEGIGSGEGSISASSDRSGAGLKFNRPDLSQAQASVQAASSAAGAYLSSWGSWAAERGKAGWRSSATSPAVSIRGPRTPTNDVDASVDSNAVKSEQLHATIAALNEEQDSKPAEGGVTKSAEKTGEKKV